MTIEEGMGRVGARGRSKMGGVKIVDFRGFTGLLYDGGVGGSPQILRDRP